VKKGPRQKETPPEPQQPGQPSSALALFSKSKWEVLVGTPQDRLEQAKLMWKALSENDRSEFESLAAAERASHAEACEKYKSDYEAWRKKLPPAARTELKQKEKEAAQAAKAQAKEQAERSKTFRVVQKNMGDTIKGNLRICRFGGKHGEWRVPDGTLRFKNIGQDCFNHIFGARGTSFTMDQSQAAAVFGITKLRGGSMYAQFTVCSMTVNYQPRENTLQLSYKMDGF